MWQVLLPDERKRKTAGWVSYLLLIMLHLATHHCPAKGGRILAQLGYLEDVGLLVRARMDSTHHAYAGNTLRPGVEQAIELAVTWHQS
jgi:hypothetical protein